MRTLKDNGTITEIEYGNNFGYVISNGAYFVNTDYKVLQNQSSELFVKCMKMLHNGQCELYYLTEDYRAFSSLLFGIQPDTFISIVINVISNIIEVRNNGFLKCQNIDISWEKIFIDVNTLKVKLVYLPISIKNYDNYAAFENELRASLVKLINNTFPVFNERIEQLASDLSNGILSLEDVHNKTSGIGIQTQRTINNNSYRTQRNETETLRIVAMNVAEYFEILVDKSEITIGKKPELVDKAITFNKMISRKHCRIVRKSGEFYISDENSANGTYVNGKRIVPNQLVKIKKGDIIRLANSDFQIV